VPHYQREFFGGQRHAEAPREDPARAPRRRRALASSGAYYHWGALLGVLSLLEPSAP